MNYKKAAEVVCIETPNSDSFGNAPLRYGIINDIYSMTKRKPNGFWITNIVKNGKRTPQNRVLF